MYTLINNYKWAPYPGITRQPGKKWELSASSHVSGHLKAKEPTIRMYPEGVFVSKPTKESYVYVCNY